LFNNVLSETNQQKSNQHSFVGHKMKMATLSLLLFVQASRAFSNVPVEYFKRKHALMQPLAPGEDQSGTL
jgi:hypothetical protein